MGTHILELIMFVIRPLIATKLMLLCILLISLGYDWIEEMHGLHPLIAFPGAIITALSALIMLFTEHHEDSSEYKGE